MNNEIEYNTVGVIEVKADIYEEPRKPYMEGSFDGDMSSDTFNEWTLDAHRFPIGTKIIFKIPECPECGEDAEFQTDEGLCDCGFDWNNWVEEQYS